MCKNKSTTGIKINKIDNATGNVINTFDTIKDAAVHENVKPTEMSRNVKHKVVITRDPSVPNSNNKYYYEKSKAIID